MSLPYACSKAGELAKDQSGGGPLVRARRLARPRPSAISTWFDVREGRRLAARSGGSKTLVPQGGRGGQWAGRAQSRGHERRLRRGGEPNYPEAAKWFRKAAELGVRDSQYNLAILYARGLGVEKDLGQSFLWFSLAAQQGDTDAAKKRDEIAGEMDPASLASAVEALMKFKAVKPNPAANEVAVPPGGWDAKPGSSSAQPIAAADAAHPQAPL